MRIRAIHCDGSPEAVSQLVEALADAFNGGPAVLPLSHPTPEPGLVDPPAGTALIIETSGSTGRAKRVLLTAEALRASASATQARLGGPGYWLLALPAQHIAGTQVIVRGLLAGHSPVVLDSRCGFRVERFTSAAAELRATAGDARRYTSLVPTQLHRILVAGEAAVDALREFDAVLVGGSATPPALLSEARAAGVRVITTYGMSETAGGCVYDGVPLDGVRIRLEEPEGRISLSGPMLATGYLGQPEQTAEAFVDGWFRTQDLGRWLGDREKRLQVIGRVDDVIITGGKKVHPAAVEQVLLEQPGVRAACVVGVPDPEWGQLVAAVVVPENPSKDSQHEPSAGQVALAAGTSSLTEPGGELRQEVDAAVRGRLGAHSVPRLIRVLPELPLRGIGKPDRTAVAQLLAEAATGAATR